MEIDEDEIDIESRVQDLLDRGLERYGEGDLEGAMAHWNHALILDPDSEKAAQYASYVQDSHDMDGGGGKGNSELDYPFGIEELGLAKMREDELEDDYESFVVEENAEEEEESTSKAKVAAKAEPEAELDGGWDLDEGWVSALVEKSETAFEAPKERPAEGEGFDDFELESYGGKPGSDDVDLKSDNSSQAEEDDDDDYAAIEIGVAGDQPKTAAPAGGDASFADLSLDEDAESDAESDLDDVDTGEHISLPPLPMELGSSGPGTGASSVADRVSEALLSLEDPTGDLEIGEAGASKLKDAENRSVFNANESGDLDLPDEADDVDGEELLARIKKDAPLEDANKRTAYVVGKLLEHALKQHGSGKFAAASSSVGIALEQADDCAAAQKLIYAKEEDLVSVLMASLGEPSEVPEMVVPLTEIPPDEIDHRTAFLLTRVDGSLSLEEILMICDMPKLEALRLLSRMHSRSYLSVR